jgi:hypothetical protein
VVGGETVSSGFGGGLLLGIVAVIVLLVLFFGFWQWNWFGSQSVAPSQQNPTVTSPVPSGNPSAQPSPS